MRKNNPRTSDNPFTPEAVEAFGKWLESQTREELIKRLTTYHEGVPHYFHGVPVEPITAEDLLNLSNENEAALEATVDRSVKDDELRPEYNESDLKNRVRGKYARRFIKSNTPKLRAHHE